MLTGIRQWQDEMIDIPAMGSNRFNSTTDGYLAEGDTPIFKLLKQATGEIIDLNGDIPEWTVNGIFTISLVEVESVPEGFGIESVYPNPFNPVTTMSFKLPMDSKVAIQIYNVQGRLIETLANHNMLAGYHSITWNADAHSSGVYFVKMVAGEFICTQKLMLVK